MGAAPLDPRHFHMIHMVVAYHIHMRDWVMLEARAGRARAAGGHANPDGMEEGGPDTDASESDGESGSEGGDNPGPHAAPAQAPCHGEGLQPEPEHELDHALAEEWQEAAQVPVPNVYWDPASYQVHLGQSSAGAILGRVKPMKINTPQECVSVYCRRHQCTKLIKAKDAPHTDNLLRWFEQGLDIPQGTDHKRQHMGLWPQ